MKLEGDGFSSFCTVDRMSDTDLYVLSLYSFRKKFQCSLLMMILESPHTYDEVRFLLTVLHDYH